MPGEPVASANAGIATSSAPKPSISAAPLSSSRGMPGASTVENSAGCARRPPARRPRVAPDVAMPRAPPTASTPATATASAGRGEHGQRGDQRRADDEDQLGRGGVQRVGGGPDAGVDPRPQRPHRARHQRRRRAGEARRRRSRPRSGAPPRTTATSSAEQQRVGRGLRRRGRARGPRRSASRPRTGAIDGRGDPQCGRREPGDRVGTGLLLHHEQQRQRHHGRGKPAGEAGEQEHRGGGKPPHGQVGTHG